ncbi:glycosyltransferase family 4 protein [Thalassospira sp.]|uniref:glycosyltransferase family 4 protein n=1 Tax=Thalassospira sp. TaxID=1912094 RepID=UPI0027326E07|nr:glycosyltransferase family 4 protein [Thalassospira sp.]MDP2698710.1 glycosyltransferase family 4 protein [Thalassospira sp.]
MKTHLVALVQLPPPIHGAAIMNQRALAALQAQYRVTILPMRFTPTIAAIGKTGIGKILSGLRLWIRLIGVIFRDRPDALYICLAPRGAAFWRDGFYVASARLAGIPCLAHLHGRGLQDGILQRFFARLVLHGQTVILPGDALRDEVAGLACDIRILPNCVSADDFASPDRPPIHRARPLNLLFLSNLIATKGIDTVIAATSILRERNIEFDLVFAGAEGDITTDQLHRKIRDAGLSDQCRYHGPVTGAAKSALLAQADLLLFPSRYRNEAQPLVVLEAMAANLPVICSPVGTLGDIIRDGETGRICAPDNPFDLADKIVLARDNPQQTVKMARAARALCQEHFGAENFGRILRHLVRDCLLISPAMPNKNGHAASQCKEAPDDP